MTEGISIKVAGVGVGAAIIIIIIITGLSFQEEHTLNHHRKRKARYEKLVNCLKN